jgi:hypothetical protein
MAKIDEGPTFGILAGISGLSGLLIIIELVWGPRWRQERMRDRETAQDRIREEAN